MKGWKLFNELTYKLASQGLKTILTSDHYLSVLDGGTELCRINGNGTILFRSEDIDTLEKDILLNNVTDLTLCVKEYISAMEAAPPLYAQNLKYGYKKLAEYNDIVLAGIEVPERNNRYDIQRLCCQY